MLSCLIVDDELPAIKILSHYITDTHYLTLTASTTDALVALQRLKTDPVDLIFLDIRMPKLTGLQLIDLLDNHHHIILTTAYSEFALEGFDRNVIDYLLKPISFERFLKATQKALDLTNKQQKDTKENQIDDFLFVKTDHKGKLVKVDTDEIIYIEALKNYVSIFTNTGDRIVTYCSLNKLETRLSPNRFMRVHRSYIVALKSIVSIDGNELWLKGAPRIPTAGKFKEQFLERFIPSSMPRKG